MIAGVSGDLLSSTSLAAFDRPEADAVADEERHWMRAVVQWWRDVERTLGPASAPRLVLDAGATPLAHLLGLHLLRVEPHPWGLSSVVAHRATPVGTLACIAWGSSAAAARRHVIGCSLAAGLPWSMTFSGTTLTVFDATHPWARRCLSFDLRTVTRTAASLRVLRTLINGTALEGGSNSPLAQTIARSDASSVAVCTTLGRGVLAALDELVRELGGGRPRDRHRVSHDRHTFEQSLTLIFRLVFLLFAEARHLVPMWHRTYRDAYSMAALCERLIADPRVRGVWAAVQAMARLAHAGCEVDDLRVTAFNGRLFAPGRTPLGERRAVRDTVAANVVLALGTEPGTTGRRSVGFHDLGVEQLGAVYERVLDYEPVRERGALTLRPTSVERKTTGSFYTPRAMTDFVVRRTLAPLTNGKSADEILRLRVIDPAMGSGAFLVAACRYLSDRVEQARLADGTWREEAVSDADRAEIMRTVAERCLFGIDHNPTAVQLARLSLWLSTMAADRPLTFLDHHLAVGNSLVGARLADLMQPPAPRGNSIRGGQLTLFDEQARLAWTRTVVPERLRLASDPSRTAADVRAKEQRFQRLSTGDVLSQQWTRAADLWCGLALSGGAIPPGLYSDLLRHLLGDSTALAARELAPLVEEAIGRSAAYHAVHWELLFPEVFFDADGHPRADAGFDAVVGNPPWEVLRADSGTDTQRGAARDVLAAAMRFIRTSGHFRLHGGGHVNQYQLFLERSIQALRPGGRLGLLLPAGLQSDVGSADLRRALLDHCRIDTWIGFDNRRAIFPIHRSVRFIVLAGTAAGHTEALPMMDGGSDPAVLARLPDEPASTAGTLPLISVTRAFVARWDSEHLSLPALTSPAAMAIAARALETPALADPQGWGVTFGRELNATDDRPRFVPAGARVDGLPIVEGKQVRPFAVDLGAVTLAVPRPYARTRLGSRWSKPRVCYRDVAAATNRLTLIAAVLPAGVVSVHTVFCARTVLSSADTWCLTALLNSLVANYLVRLQMTTHVTTTLMARLPVPRPFAGSAVHAELGRLAAVLSSHGAIDDQPEAYARLNAIAAGLYGLDAAAYAHVISTFPLLGPALCSGLRHAPPLGDLNAPSTMRSWR